MLSLVFDDCCLVSAAVCRCSLFVVCCLILVGGCLGFVVVCCSLIVGCCFCCLVSLVVVDRFLICVGRCVLLFVVVVDWCPLSLLDVCSCLFVVVC